MAKATKLKINTSWRNVVNVWENVHGVWKKEVVPKVKINNLYKECIEYYSPVILVSEGNQYIRAYDSNLNMLWERDFGTLFSGAVSVARNIHEDSFFMRGYNYTTDKVHTYKLDVKSGNTITSMTINNDESSCKKIRVNKFGDVYNAPSRSYMRKYTNELVQVAYKSISYDGVLNFYCNIEDDEAYIWINNRNTGGSRATILDKDLNMPGYSSTYMPQKYHDGFVHEGALYGINSGLNKYMVTAEGGVTSVQVTSQKLEVVTKYRSSNRIIGAEDDDYLYAMNIDGSNLIQIPSSGVVRPVGIDISNDDYIFLIDDSTKKLMKFDENGLIKSITLPWTPADMAVI
ncbi:hypothetical protein EZV73_26565 [Acidaminobacter sp. JC074]|uniref:hypothetical protein n=1 Tax=Acidaminobacter sp. JC074 TaxID=2530199 RepID=UPI001F0F05F3|nr:hypothetical protein [Acidaminobacter sp. JC074]MCH4891170.1 hypothetical protein [Acidaminobacter sp. JC074]